MLMGRETIIELYKKSLEDGDPVRQIKSLAKANNVKATAIKNILIEEGLEVPEKIPTGPMKVEKPMVIEAADPVPGEIGYERPKAAAKDIPEAVRVHLKESMTGLLIEIDDLRQQIKAKEQEYDEILEFVNRWEGS